MMQLLLGIFCSTALPDTCIDTERVGDRPRGRSLFLSVQGSSIEASPFVSGVAVEP